MWDSRHLSVPLGRGRTTALKIPSKCFGGQRQCSYCVWLWKSFLRKMQPRGQKAQAEEFDHIKGNMRPPSCATDRHVHDGVQFKMSVFRLCSSTLTHISHRNIWGFTPVHVRSHGACSRDFMREGGVVPAAGLGGRLSCPPFLDWKPPPEGTKPAQQPRAWEHLGVRTRGFSSGSSQR